MSQLKGVTFLLANLKTVVSECFCLLLLSKPQTHMEPKGGFG